MGLDLRLSGLASGFDWKPVVEQLIELERIPQKRLVREQDANSAKISELGILKSQNKTSWRLRPHVDPRQNVRNGHHRGRGTFFTV